MSAPPPCHPCPHAADLLAALDHLTEERRRLALADHLLGQRVRSEAAHRERAERLEDEVRELRERVTALEGELRGTGRGG